VNFFVRATLAYYPCSNPLFKNKASRRIFWPSSSIWISFTISK